EPVFLAVDHPTLPRLFLWGANLAGYRYSGRIFGSYEIRRKKKAAYYPNRHSRCKKYLFPHGRSLREIKFKKSLWKYQPGAALLLPLAAYASQPKAARSQWLARLAFQFPPALTTPSMASPSTLPTYSSFPAVNVMRFPSNRPSTTCRVSPPDLSVPEII